MLEGTQSEADPTVVVQPLHVDVYAFRVEDTVLFSHTWKRLGDPGSKQGKIEVPKGERDVPIHFQLHDKTDPSVHLRFYADAADSIWVDTEDCPSAEGAAGQITYGPSGGNSLIVTDLNTVKCDLHYSLRFQGDELGDKPPYEYDPEIRNGGN